MRSRCRKRIPGNDPPRHPRCESRDRAGADAGRADEVALRAGHYLDAFDYQPFRRQLG
jgi:hypothetical protein